MRYLLCMCRTRILSLAPRMISSPCQMLSQRKKIKCVVGVAPKHKPSKTSQTVGFRSYVCPFFSLCMLVTTIKLCYKPCHVSFITNLIIISFVVLCVYPNYHHTCHLLVCIASLDSCLQTIVSSIVSCLSILFKVLIVFYFILLIIY